MPGVIQKDVEVPWHVAERPQKQRDLSSMVNAVNGRMVQQLSQGHRLPGAATDRKLHHMLEIRILESGQQLADARFDVAPPLE